MRRFGLIGFPVGHSGSPELFRRAYHSEDMVYELVEEQDFGRAYGRFLSRYEAVNVTAPFKEEAFRRADKSDEITSSIGAANVLVKGPQGLVEAYNTDFLAVTAILERHCNAGKPRCVCVVGCGGAGKAAAQASACLGCRTLVVNRDFGRAQSFCMKNNVARASGSGRMEAFAPDSLGRCMESSDFVVYTVPVLLEGLSAEAFSGRTVLEANYRNPNLKDLCRAGGGTYVGGGEWLVEQAIAGFQIMTGIVPDGNSMKASPLYQSS